MWHAKPTECRHHRLLASFVGRDGENAKSLPPELTFMLLSDIGGEIGAHLALKARLRQIAAYDRHGAAVDFDHKAATGAIGEHEAESKVRDNVDVVQHAVVREFGAEREWAAGIDAVIRKRRCEFVGMHEAEVGAAARRTLQRDVEVHDPKLMLDEWPTGLAILAAPLDIGEIDAVPFDQEPGAAVGERIDNRRRTRRRVIVELRARPIDVARMEEPREAIIGAIERAADESRNVGRTQEAMPRQVAHDRHVVVGDAEGGWFRRTAEPRSTSGLRDSQFAHAGIIASTRRRSNAALTLQGKLIVSARAHIRIHGRTFANMLLVSGKRSAV